MSKRKPGLSLEDKVIRTEAYLQETRVPFTLKELEALLPKAKGVIFQSVLECLDTLVSEGRADSDKVGVSTLFWNFLEYGESTAKNSSSSNEAGANDGNKNNTNNKNSTAFLLSGNTETKQQRLVSLEQKKDQLRQQLQQLEQLVERASETQEQLQYRHQLTQQINFLRGEKQKLALILKERSATLCFSPQRLKKQYDLLKTLTNYWTDNVMLLKDGVCGKGWSSGGGGGGFNDDSSSSSSSSNFVLMNKMHPDDFNRKFGLERHFDFVEDE